MDVRQQRVEFVIAAKRGSQPFRSLCMEFGISKVMQTQEKPNNDFKSIGIARASTTLGLNTAELIVDLQNGVFLGSNFFLNPTLQADDSRSQPFWVRLSFDTPAENIVLNG
jgi:hypothetical protein